MVRPLFGRLHGRAESDGIGDIGNGHRIDAGSFDTKMAKAQYPAPETLGDAYAFNVLQSNLVGGQREQPGLFDEAMRGDGNLGGPFADHHGEENPDADDENPQQNQRRPSLEAVPPMKMGLADNLLAVTQ